MVNESVSFIDIDRLRGQMREKHITNKKLANMLNLSAQSVSSRLTKKTFFTLGETNCLVDVFGYYVLDHNLTKGIYQAELARMEKEQSANL